jgi:hypothetical protein
MRALEESRTLYCGFNAQKRGAFYPSSADKRFSRGIQKQNAEHSFQE